MDKRIKEKREAFRLYLMEEEKAASTIEKYMRDLKAFEAWVGDKGLDKSLVLLYKQVLQEKYKPSSVNSILSSLNSFFKYCNWHELRVKTLKIQQQMFVKSNKELSKREYERLIRAAGNNKKLSYLLQTICSTGIRISELEFITVEAVKNAYANINCKGKLRTVFLPKSLCVILKEYINEEKIEKGPVFVTRNGNPVDRSNVWKSMKKLYNTANVEKDKVFPHNLRHLFARTYYSLQKDVVRLADILGHSSVNTTRVYTSECGRVHQMQIQKLGLLVK